MARSPHYLYLALAAALAFHCGGSDGGPGGGSSSGETACVEATCTADEVCTYVLWTCGQSDSISAAGSCLPRPASCEPQDQPVCGCDGAVHANACEALIAGIDLAGYSTVDCPVPDGHYACGYAFCKLGEQWCREEFEGEWTCEALPDACKQPGADCSCLGFTMDGPTPDAPEGCFECYERGDYFELICGVF